MFGSKLYLNQPYPMLPDTQTAPPPTPNAPENPAPQITPPEDKSVHVHLDAKPTSNSKEREEIRDAVAGSFLDRLIGKGKEKKETPKPETPEPAAEPENKETKVESPAPAVKPRKSKKVAEPKPITEEDMVRVASEAATRAASEVQQRSPVPEVPHGTFEAPLEPEVSKSLAKELPIYRKLAEMEPRKYGNVVKELSEFSAKEKQYRKDWESQNPGATFDPEAADHNDFFERNFPSVDSEDFDAAKESIIEERAAAKAEERIAKKMEEKYGPDIERIQQERAAQAMRPALETTLKAAVVDILGAIDEKYAPLAEDVAKLDTLKTVDPMASDVADEVCAQAMPILVEVKRIHTQDGKGKFLFPYDPKNPDKPVHAIIANLVEVAEKNIPTLPRADQVDGKGRSFATWRDYAAMSPQERSKHWFLDEENLTYLVMGEARREARDRYQLKKDQHKKYTGSDYSPPGIAGKASPAEKNGEAKDVHKPLNVNVKPESPSVSGKPVTSNGAGSGGDGSSSGTSVFWKRMGMQ
jgi:hypothetical protein